MNDTVFCSGLHAIPEVMSKIFAKTEKRILEIMRFRLCRRVEFITIEAYREANSHYVKRIT